MRWMLIAMCLMSCAVLADDADVVDKAKDINSLIREKVGSKERINQNLLSPLTTDNEMKTFDGNKSFSAQAACVASNEFLKMFVQPLNTGDVQFLNIQQDTNMDGKIDSSLKPNWHISGVCANGFIQCDPGTWNNCQSKRWIVEDNGVLNVEDVAFSDLGGCYCVNNNCGTGLVWSNMKAVLSNLGGGAAGALAKRNPFYTIADVKQDDVTITYYGQDSESCKSYKMDDTLSNVGTKKLIEYSKMPSKISHDAFGQAETSNVYKTIKESYLNTDKEVEYRQCSIKRKIPVNETTLNDIIGYESGTGNITTCGSDCLLLTLGKVGDNYWGGNCSMYQHNVRFYVKRPERIKKAILHQAVWDDWIQIHANNKFIWSGPNNNWTDPSGPQPGACELGTSWNQNPNVDFTDTLKNKGPVDFRVRVEVTGGGEGYARASVKVDTSCYLDPDEIIDSCSAYADDVDCELIDENVDGVFTYKDAAATGLIPLPQERDANGSSCSFKVKRDWFNKERRYLCRKKKKYDYDSVIKRKAHIEDTATETSYEDRKTDPDTGMVTYESGDLSIKDPIKVHACTHVCKTRKARPQNDASVGGVTGQNARNPITYDFFYHECDENDLCPSQAGEEVIKSCQCINEFSEATAIMQSIRSAGQDIICSSGELKNLDSY